MTTLSCPTSRSEPKLRKSVAIGKKMFFFSCIPEEEQLQFCDVLVAGWGVGVVGCFVCLQVHVEARGSSRCLSIGDIHLSERANLLSLAQSSQVS